MPVYVALVKFNESKTSEEQLNAGQAAYDLALEESGGTAAITTSSGYIGLFWTEGELDMVLTYSKRDEDEARAFANRLEKRQDSTIQVLKSLTEGEKERELKGRVV
tara:strand:- start:161 stop:478 length:318 start_codon:yes stop_codon:yes gene_type:complete